MPHPAPPAGHQHTPRSSTWPTCFIRVLFQCGPEPQQPIPTGPVQAELCVQVCRVAGGITGGHEGAHEGAAANASWPQGQPAALLVVLLLLQVGRVAGKCLDIAAHRADVKQPGLNQCSNVQGCVEQQQQQQ